MFSDATDAAGELVNEITGETDEEPTASMGPQSPTTAGRRKRKIPEGSIRREEDDEDSTENHPKLLNDELSRAKDIPRGNMLQAAATVRRSKTSQYYSKYMCDCVYLVTDGTTDISVDKPDLESSSAAAGHLTPTLRSLSVGYKNYVENNIADSAHILTSYNCRSPKLKIFNNYKTITCNRKKIQPFVYNNPVEPEAGSSDGGGNIDIDRIFYKTLMNINQYLRVFSTLADFNYTWITPALIGGTCNVMVVEKRWTYSRERLVYLPNYRLLVGDSYTDFVVNGMRNLKNKDIPIKYIAFMSCATTILYTHRRALFNSEEENVYYLDLKHRLDHVGLDASEINAEEDLRGVGCTDPLWRELPPATDEQGVVMPTNPTLVVFSHNIEGGAPDTLLCNIIVEMDLAHETVY